jgi:hypothetical protein
MGKTRFRDKHARVEIYLETAGFRGWGVKSLGMLTVQQAEEYRNVSCAAREFLSSGLRKIPSVVSSGARSTSHSILYDTVVAMQTENR